MEPTRIETETKFLLPSRSALADVPRALPKLVDLIEPRGTFAIHDTYLDTGDWWFFRAGLACRIRRETRPDGKRQAWLMLKELAKPANGISRRMEFEERLAVPQAAADSLPGGKLGRRLREQLGGRTVRGLFEIHNQRTICNVRVGDLVAEVAADEVTFAAGERRETLAEVEIEAVTGPAEALADLANRLKAAVGGQEAAASKYQSGLSLAGLDPPSRVNLRQLHWRLTDRALDVARGVLANQLMQMEWNEPGARMGLDCEFVHQMRVAVRRFRAALEVFGPVLGRKVSADLRRGLSAVSTALGEVRDLDVYLLTLPQYAERVGGADSEVIRRYRARLVRRRDRARKGLLRVLDSGEFTALDARIRAMLSSPPASTNADDRLGDESLAGTPLAEFACGAVRKRLKRVLKAGRAAIAGDSDARRHELRLKIKRLRYAVEFVQSLYGRVAERFVRRLVGLQDALGGLQDAIVAANLLKGFTVTVGRGGAKSNALRADIGRLVLWQEQEQANYRLAAQRQWRNFDRKKVRRKFLTCLDAVAEAVKTAG